MKKIQMVDLISQYQPIKAQINAGFEEVMNSAAFVNGPQVNLFSENLQKYLNIKHVIPCGNGTEALQIALMSLDLQPGDEVITADFTFAATVEVISLLKLHSVLVDVDYNTFTIDPEAIKKAITPKTKAIIPVHLFGQCANMEEILAIAKEHNLYVIEDNAQAIGAEYKFKDGTVKKSGTMGTIGTTSFFPSKNLGCYGDGGAIFTDNDELAHRLRGIVNHGMYKRYYHDEVGVNSRLDSLQAVILNTKLPLLNSYNEKRRKTAEYYDRAFANHPNIIIPARAENTSHVFHQYTIKVINADRNALQKHLSEKEIPAMIYYPVPLRKQKAYDNGTYKDSDFPATNKLIDQVLSLPMHTELEKDQLDYIIENVLNFFK